jgi:hypothetical protein
MAHLRIQKTRDEVSGNERTAGMPDPADVESFWREAMARGLRVHEIEEAVAERVADRERRGEIIEALRAEYRELCLGRERDLVEWCQVHGLDPLPVQADYRRHVGIGAWGDEITWTAIEGGLGRWYASQQSNWTRALRLIIDHTFTRSMIVSVRPLGSPDLAEADLMQVGIRPWVSYEQGVWSALGVFFPSFTFAREQLLAEGALEARRVLLENGAETCVSLGKTPEAGGAIPEKWEQEKIAYREYLRERTRDVGFAKCFQAFCREPIMKKMTLEMVHTLEETLEKKHNDYWGETRPLPGKRGPVKGWKARGASHKF